MTKEEMEEIMQEYFAANAAAAAAEAVACAALVEVVANVALTADAAWAAWAPAGVGVAPAVAAREVAFKKYQEALKEFNNQ